jgi:hypothetical protein
MKVARSIPNEDVGFFISPNPCSRTTALASTEPLTDMNIRSLPWDKARPARKADNLTAICESRPYCPPRPVTGIFDLFFHNPITVAVRSETRNVFVRSNTGIVGSDPTWGMDVCVCRFCLCCPVNRWLLYDGLIPRPRSPTDYVQDYESDHGSKEGCRATDEESPTKSRIVQQE